MPLTDFVFDPSYQSSPDYDPALWCTMYSVMKKRYLEDLSEAELQTRYEVVLRNKASFSSPEHIAHRPHNDPISFWYWVRREEECAEEFRLRGLPLTTVTLGIPAALRNLTPPVARRSLRDSGLIARFAEDRWLRLAFEKGQFRIKHAKGFRDSGLNDAQRDDELIASTFSPSRGVTIQLPDGTTTKPKGKFSYQRKQGGDAYLLCTATEFDPWLFHYFQCDACMIIENVEELRLRLDAAFTAKMNDYGQAEFRVGYIDEYNPNAVLTKNDDAQAVPSYRPLATKGLRYAHQKEFRFLWYSKHSTSPTAPDYVDVEAGSLKDIAKYYRFNSAAGTLEQMH